jgi:hypothetical protein
VVNRLFTTWRAEYPGFRREQFASSLTPLVAEFTTRVSQIQ